MAQLPPAPCEQDTAPEHNYVIPASPDSGKLSSLVAGRVEHVARQFQDKCQSQNLWSGGSIVELGYLGFSVFKFARVLCCMGTRHEAPL
jgi:hypothetical protein